MDVRDIYGSGGINYPDMVKGFAKSQRSKKKPKPVSESIGKFSKKAKKPVKKSSVKRKASSWLDTAKESIGNIVDPTAPTTTPNKPESLWDKLNVTKYTDQITNKMDEVTGGGQKKDMIEQGLVTMALPLLMKMLIGQDKPQQAPPPAQPPPNPNTTGTAQNLPNYQNLLGIPTNYDAKRYIMGR